ncbi:hypothetical protein NESM_000509300 [Novymonas esmeraldas]|uniref:Uncharacterized protein n=1 Tax=Novymonas esmeraldas TaxID=1808958 RepID=A0AAW0EQI8_9TRYP
MMRRAAALRCGFHGVGDDRRALARHHKQLLDRRHWELATPSRALPVVDVLLRSGVLLDGVERSCVAPLTKMAPSMTKRERTLVGRLSHMLHQGASPAASRPCPSSPTAEEAVRAAYAAACATGACTMDAVVNAEFVRQLRDPGSVLMLLELAESRCMSVSWTVAPPPFSKDLLDPVCDVLSQHEQLLGFKVVCWLLSLLDSRAPPTNARVSPAAGRRLFRLCVRRIHHLLPELQLEELLVAYLLLTGSEGYEEPFVVVKEAEKLVLSASPENFAHVSSGVLLRFMTTPLATQRTELNLHLCAGWRTASRIADFTREECLAAFAVLTALHERCPAEGAAAVAPMRDWETLHDAVFAQLFFFAADMSAADCFRVLDLSELVNISGWGITVPQMLLEKLKRQVVAECQHSAADECLAPAAAEALLRIALGLQALMHRFTVLPSNPTDDRAVAECIVLLERHLTPLQPHR